MQTQAEIQEIIRQRDEAQRDIMELKAELSASRLSTQQVVSDGIYVQMLAAVFRDDEWKQGAHPEADIAHRIDVAKRMTMAAIHVRPMWVQP